MRHGVFLKIVASIALVLVMGFCSRGAWAQDGAPIVKKAPPRMAGGGDAPADSGGDSAMPAQKAGPRTASNATAEQMKPPADEVIDSFKKAYRKAGRPKLLILVGLARDPLHDPGQGGIVGGKAQGVGVGEDLSFTDTTGITELLENGIGEILNDDGTIKLVDRAALVEKDRRDAESLAQNDADEAIDAMARKVNADLVLFIKFRPTTLANAGQTNYAFSCISELKDINTAQKLPLTPFNWDGELNNERARVYSAVLSNLICQRYAKWQAATGGLRDMSVKIISFADSQAPAKVRRLLKKMDGVDGDVDMSTETTTDGGTNATYEFQFDGNGADLQDAITDAAKGAGLPLAVLDQKKNSIIFRVGGDGATAQAPDWWLISDANPNPVKDRFLAAYKKNPQSVVLVINWVVRPEQMGWLEQLHQPLIRTQNDIRLDNKPLGPQTVELEQASTEVARVLQGLGVQMVDAGQVGRIQKHESNKADKLRDDQTLGDILSNDDGYDLCVVGSACVGHDGLDFKLINRRNAKWVGGVTWPPSALQISQDHVGRKLLDKALANPDKVAGDAATTRYIAGNILLAIETATSGEAMIPVSVRHAPSQAAVQSLADALKAIPEVSTDGVRMDNGLGSFNVHYTGAFQDLEERMRRVLESKPDLKLVELNPSWMTVDVATK